MSKVIVTQQDAIEMLPEGDEIHTFINAVPGVMLGADWSRKDVIEAIGRCMCELAGETARRMKHGLAIWTREDRPLFVETREDFDYSRLEAVENV